MSKILKQIRFQDYYKFEQGGLSVMGIKGLMFTTTFICVLYQIATQLSSKKRIDEIIYRTGNRQAENALVYIKNHIGLPNADPAQICQYILGQSEISGMGTMALTKIDEKQKKAWFVLKTEHFEDIYTSIYPHSPTIKTAIIQYLKGAISAVVSYVFEISNCMVTINQKDTLYYFMAEPAKSDSSNFSSAELQKIQKSLQAYTWKHF